MYPQLRVIGRTRLEAREARGHDMTAGLACGAQLLPPGAAYIPFVYRDPRRVDRRGGVVVVLGAIPVGRCAGSIHGAPSQGGAVPVSYPPAVERIADRGGGVGDGDRGTPPVTGVVI